MTTTSVKPPISFWIISALAIIWNVMGVLAFIGDLMITDELLAQMPETERNLRAQFPEWSTTVYGIATISGAIAALLMSLRKKLSHYVFLISLLAVLVQMYYTIFVVKVADVMGPTSLIFPIIIIGIGIFLLAYTFYALKKQWLK
ncbi:hypothetical protein SAMN05216480_101388 [Pustulibacterium marinum]|uniref:Sugar transporter n=1 Tax=Pustulibacterium marinum TaxID=1224947 RepID=A0A1I7EXG0_9FLAO|nr:hypothetical protein [Pustulibacterium marinum]SFU28640.1 hypothetical protein SAMN05216480_101388 [Pustulibacterium marinum]